MNKREHEIIKKVDQLTDDILDFTNRLVSEPSTLGNEASVMQVMEDELVKLSFHPVRVPIDVDVLAEHPGFAPVPWHYDDRVNIVATREAGSKGGQSLLFNGHLDVVSPEPMSLWGQDPFKPVERDGWLYGRGAGDMKSGVAAMTYAVHAVEKAGFSLKAPVTIEAVIEEECTGNGTLACLNAGYDAQAILIPEPTAHTFTTTQVGVLWFNVLVRGAPTHVATAQAGTNAIEKSYLLIAALRELEEELNHADIHPAYRNTPHPINLNIGIFKGGDWPSTVPAEAVFHGRLSFFPGVSYDDICRRIIQAVERAAKKDPWLKDNPPRVEFYAFRSEGHSVSQDLPIFKALRKCHHDLTGEDVQAPPNTATTDLRGFHFFGQGQSTCYGPVAENIHAANERVMIESVIHVARVYTLFLSRWCGLSE